MLRRACRFLTNAGKTKITNQLWDGRGPPQTVGELPAELVDKTPEDSVVIVDYPFTTDPELRDEYISPTGGLRIGPLLEDLDACAGSVAFHHAEDNNPNTRPLNIVTASVDAVELKRPSLRLDRDLKVFGRPVYVGKSSLEVLVHLQSENKTVLNAFFTMVAIDARTGRPTPINKLHPVTEQEKIWFQEGERRKAAKQQGRLTDLKVSPPQATELPIIHDFFTNKSTWASKPNIVAMNDAYMQSVTLCVPQLRNRAGKVFGGHLMKIAFELAWSNVQVFCKGARPTFVAMERVTFLSPVNIGDIIVASSHVNYSDPRKGHVCADVVIQILDPTTGEKRKSNTFGFIFSQQSDGGVAPLRQLVPHTYSEAMHYLQAKRRSDGMAAAVAAIQAMEHPPLGMSYHVQPGRHRPEFPIYKQ